MENSNKRNKNSTYSTQMLVEAGIVLALAFVLKMIPLYVMPMGGDISLAMLPIVIYSIRWGVWPGVLVGLLYGVIKIILGVQIIHPIQVLIEYPLPSAIIGLAGISFAKNKTKLAGYIPSIVTAYLLKLLTHFLAGVIYWPQYAPEGMNVLWYSFVYNTTYMIPELILFLIVITLIWKPLSRVIKQQDRY